MKISLDGKNAIVTGGARGIGASLSQALLQCGAEVFIVGRNPESFEKFKKENSTFRSKMHFFACDLASQEQVETLCQKLSKEHFDVLINNAGINKIALTHEVELQDFEAIQHMNVKVPLLLSQAVIPSMLKNRWGRIVNMASVFGTQTRSRRLSYTTSKAALIGMTKTMAVDYAEKNILVNVVSPGFIDTDLTRSILKPGEIELLIQSIPMKRLGQIHELASIVAFLASDLNTLMTGQNIVIDGGFSVV